MTVDAMPVDGLEVLSGVPEGMDALVLNRIVRELGRDDEKRLIVHVTRDDRGLDALERQLHFFAPDLQVVPFPAWDTVPYDRVSPNSGIVSRRIASLTQLAFGRHKAAIVLLTTVNAILQRVPPHGYLRRQLKQISAGQRLDMNRLTARLLLAGYQRTGTVMEPGEFAVRGGIVDLYAPGRSRPIRLDFFGDTLESIKSFDVETQRTVRQVRKVTLMPISEVAFGDAATARFRTHYVELFGGATREDPLYESVSAGQRYPGQEHWLPLFHESLETLLDYVPADAPVSFDHYALDAVPERMAQIREHYQARVDALEVEAFGAPPYKPVPPDRMFLEETAWHNELSGRPTRRFSHFDDPSAPATRSFGGRAGRTFAIERQSQEMNVFDAVVAHVRAQRASQRQVIITGWTPGALERLGGLLRDHGLSKIKTVEDLGDAMRLADDTTALAVLGLERGFETPDLAVIAEQDILGDRLVRPRRKSRKAVDVLTEATGLSVDDLVVHADHGIGRFAGLKTITALNAPHDCLELVYSGGDKLYLPVENIELLSRYGSDDTTAQLDRLGGVQWQTRKARLKKRLRDMAAELIKVAALRQLREAETIAAPPGLYEEFVARFPYEETDDQTASIDAVREDLASGRPMDRLVCGDVGFGKTEVAMRAAFISAMNGLQVAVVVPTTLLARQHYNTFAERFQGLPVTIAQASRLVAPKTLAEVKDGLKAGKIDIVIGTHALLGARIEFQRLGLLVIDEEQHFGVVHKERLKKMREDVHVLTLSATPIPRTLQLALTGVRELSLITTPPVDRLAIRTYISQVDPVVLRDALKRERFRGGQTFFVVPRITDLDDVCEFLQDAVPELKIARAHGQLPAGTLEDVMTAFYDGEYDVLVSTAIVESGLDVPNANTLIVHRSDMFGLAQLYQLRGRVGRSKARAYAYFTTPPGQKLTPGAEKRLKVLQSLDTLGAGFSLASHDLDIRGAGNLLGEEQSGHIREVGFELYQSMLEEAVVAMKGGKGEEAGDAWSPEIALGVAALIPESYAGDLQVRLGLYRRLAKFESRDEIDAFAAELVDRFGSMPPEVGQLLDIIEIKGLCRQANVVKVDAGPKGAVIAFRDNTFANPEGIVALIQDSHGAIKLIDGQKLVYRADWETVNVRIKGVRAFVSELVDLAGKGRKAA